MAIHSSILAWRIPWTEEPGETSYFYLLINSCCPLLNVHLRLGFECLKYCFQIIITFNRLLFSQRKTLEGFTVTGRKEYFSLLLLVWGTRYSKGNHATICFDNIQQNRKVMHYWAHTEILADEISKQGGVGRRRKRGREELRTEQG